jgi:site-specific DNA-cytosine methylase
VAAAVINVELFPCSGGMAEGFRRAGITFDVAFDISTDACDSYARNLGHRPVQMDVRDVVRLLKLGWRPGAVRLLVADPPCTPWSRAGKREGLNDERDMLRETVDIIRLLRPSCYLIGNVPGLEDSTNWHVVQDVVGGLARDGYCVRDFATLDAADYGVPQHRIRPFWFGHLAGACIRWPSPTHASADDVRRAALQPSLISSAPARLPWVTCREALAHLPREDWGKPWRRRERACNGKEHASQDGKPARVVGTTNLSDGNVLELQAPVTPPRTWHNANPASVIDEPAKTLTTKAQGGHGGGAAALVLEAQAAEKPRRRFHPSSKLDAPANVIITKAQGGPNGGAGTLKLGFVGPQSEETKPSATITSARNNSLRHPPSRADDVGNVISAQGSRHQCNTLEWPWERPSTTVCCARSAIPPPGHHPESGSILSQPGVILLSEKAAAALQAFPPDWHFAGKTKSARWQQIGMAMPPPLAEAVARAVAAQMKAPQ